MIKPIRLLWAALALCAASVHAQKTDPADAGATQSKSEQLLAALKPEHGTIKLPNGIATLELSNEFYYLSPNDTERLLTQGWGNPPGTKTLGMIVPQATSPLSDQGWGVVITYNDDGHVSDQDAAKIDYSKLLKDMQEADESDNAQRKKDGYAALHLLGWAEPPYYDAQSHKMYWAKELKSDDASGNTLNYNIRVLGRQGVLELTAVAAMADFPKIKQEMPKVLASTNFDPGNRYTDYQAGSDKLAAYGLAALVAGGIAAKAGLFAKLGVLLLALKKFIIIGLAAIGAFLRKLFGRPKKLAAQDGSQPPSV
jgi:uncharacterized membrane-anchored protein